MKKSFEEEIRKSKRNLAILYSLALAMIVIMVGVIVWLLIK